MLFDTFAFYHCVRDGGGVIVQAPLGIFLVWFACRQLLGGEPDFTENRQPLVIIYNGLGRCNHFEYSFFK